MSAPPGGGAAILNGFGRTFGDTLIGLTALAAAQRAGLWPVPVTLYRLPGLGKMIDGLHEAFTGSLTRDLPWAAAAAGATFTPAAHDRVLDLRDFAYDSRFARTSMVDFFLARLGLDPASLAPAERRNTWLAACVLPAPPALPAGYLLLCPRANGALRGMPTETARALAAVMAEAGPVVAQGDTLAGALVAPAPTCLAELCGLVAASRAVVSTDTGMVHLADAFSIPTIAIFPTHEPAWRVRDYPHCRAIRLSSRLPPGLEFPRDDADLAAAAAAWRDTPDLAARVEAGLLAALANTSKCEA